MWRREFGVGVAAVAWFTAVGCDRPMLGRAGVTSDDGAAGAETETTASTPEPAEEIAVVREPCADAGLWRFPGMPQKVVIAGDGDAIVAGTGDAGALVVRYDSAFCDVVWEVAPGLAVRDMALVGPDIVLIGEGLVRLVADTGATRALDTLAGGVIAGDGALIWIANGDLMRVERGVSTVVRRDLAITDLVARGDAVFAAIGSDVWRFTRTEAERIATFAGSELSLVLDDGGDLFVTSNVPRLRVERIGDQAWFHEAVAGVTGWTTRAGPDLVIAGNASTPPVGTAAATSVGTAAATSDFDLTQVAAGDAYVARMAPHMAIMWTLEVIGGDGVQTVTGVGGDAGGRQWVIGWAEREVVIGEDVLYGGGGFVARRPLGPGW
jgi:hypothetical protein